MNDIHGLFKIHPKIYQVRNFDLSNMTLIEGKTGWILIDPLSTNTTWVGTMEIPPTSIPFPR